MPSWANFPFSPRRVPVFYGWVVLVVATLGIISSIPGQTMGVSVFTDPLMTALGLTREQISLAYLFGTVASSLIMLKAGALIDRFGARITMMIASVALGLSLTLTANSGRILEWWKPSASVTGGGAAGFIIVLVCFFAFRFFGQGLMALAPRVVLGRWFDRYRGRVFGISGLFVSFGFATAPLGLNALIEARGWQGAYYALAFFVATGMSTLAFLFYRERPEDYGMNQDGAPHEDEEATALRRLANGRDFTVEEARKTGAFWAFTLGLSFQSLVVTAVTFHIVSLTEWSGLNKEQGLALFLPIAITSVITSLIAGWLNDRGMKLQHLLMIMMVGQATGTLSVLAMDTVAGRAALAVGFGISGGLFGTLVGVAWPRLFGLRHLGAISGLNMSIMVFSSAMGPSVLAVSQQRAGSYTPGLIACAFLPLIIFAAATRVRDPQNPPLPDDVEYS